MHPLCCPYLGNASALCASMGVHNKVFAEISDLAGHFKICIKTGQINTTKV